MLHSPRLGPLRKIFWIALLLQAAVAGFIVGGLLWFWNSLPEGLEDLDVFAPQELTRVMASDGEVIGEFYLQRREVIPLENIPPHVINAFVSAEDGRFFEHRGLDPVGIGRAALKNFQAGRVVQGGSTITQQLARALLLGPERTATRKIREALLAFRIERRLSKEQIIHQYLNYIYLGHGAYGVQAAAQVYFGKDADRLTISEGAILAGLPKAPSLINPYVNMERARERQRYVLERMGVEGHLEADQVEAHWNQPIQLSSSEPVAGAVAPDYVEHVRRYLRRHYGHSALYRGGLRVVTALDLEHQRAAEVSLRRGLEETDHRQGFRGPVRQLDPLQAAAFLQQGVRPVGGGSLDFLTPQCGEEICAGGHYEALVVGIHRDSLQLQIGAHPATMVQDSHELWQSAGVRRGPRLWKVDRGDVVGVRVLEISSNGQLMVEPFQVPSLQGALLAMEPHTGLVSAMVGGYSFRQSEFNRAVQARRQVGSTVKPFLFSAALSQGFTQVSVINDSPASYRTSSGVWRPRNYGGRYRGPITLRTALAFSSNSVAVKLAAQVGVDAMIARTRDLGITSDLPANLSLALGSASASPLEMVRAYAVFPSGGVKVEPVFITRVMDVEGNVLEETDQVGPREQVVSPDHAYVMTDIMEAVVKDGTGRQAGRLDLPAAGKTGTTNDFRDAWFVGYTPQIVVGVWLGRDDFSPIGPGESGARAALPVWTDFVEEVTQGIDVSDFYLPPGVVLARTNPQTGAPARPGDSNAILIPFEKGTVPEVFLQNRGTRRHRLDDLFF